MLVELLSKLSEFERQEILGEKPLSFSKSLSEGVLKSEDVSNAIITHTGIQLITNKNYRDRLISLMVDSQANKVLCEYGEVKIASPWSRLKNVSKSNLSILANSLGLSEEWDAYLTEDFATKDVLPVDVGYGLYPYQITISNKITSLLRDPDISRALIHLPTGAGKTRTAMDIVCQHLRENVDGLVVWLADTEELCAQALGEFQKAWKCLGNRNTNSYSYYSDSQKSLSGIHDGFLVAGLLKLNCTKKSDREFLYQKLIGNVTLVVFDEAHKAIAPKYSEMINELVSGQENKAFFLGLTATPGRTFDLASDENKRLSSFFHDKKVAMNVKGYSSPIQYLIEEGYLARPEFLSLEYTGSLNVKISPSDVSDSNISSDLLSRLSIVEDRNAVIIQKIILEYEQGSSIIVFACSVSHANFLSSALCCLGYSAASITRRGDNSESRRRKISRYRSGELKVLINYGILTAGFDAPKTNVAIIARPTPSLVLYSQMVGRAMRGKQSKGNEHCRIYTVIDNIPEFNSVHRAFVHWDRFWGNNE